MPGPLPPAGSATTRPGGHHHQPEASAEARVAGMYRTAGGDSVRVFIEEGRLGAHQPGEFRALLLPESTQDYFVVQLNGTARFRERDRRMTLDIEDALGRTVVRAVREGR